MWNVERANIKWKLCKETEGNAAVNCEILKFPRKQSQGTKYDARKTRCYKTARKQVMTSLNKEQLLRASL
jgi:hypothetical protein